MGRHGWFDEVMRFYDQYLRGEAPSVVRIPPVAVETSDGSWRSRGPVAAGRRLLGLHGARSPARTPTTPRTTAPATAARTGTGIWTFSPPLAHDAHLAGIPKVTVNASIVLARREPRRRRLRRRLRRQGDARSAAARTCCRAAARCRFDLYGDDWKLPGRPSRRRAAHLVELRVVAAPPDAAAGHGRARASISLPWRSCEGGAGDRGRPLDQARLLQGLRALHGRRSDDRRRHAHPRPSRS